MIQTAVPTMTYQLSAPLAPSTPPALDEFQQAVVAHQQGPLLVLAGPGTGKTTTMIELIVDVVQNRGVDPSQILALTFSRVAAAQLRSRVTARLGRTLGTTLAATFHSFAYSLVRAHADQALYSAPLRLFNAAQSDAVLRELLVPTPESVVWPEPLAEAARAPGFAGEVQRLLSSARDKGLTSVDLVRLGKQHRRAEWQAAGQLMAQYLDNLDAQSGIDYPGLITRAVALAQQPSVAAELAQRYRWVLVDEYQDSDPSQVALLAAIAGQGRNLVAVGDPDQSIYAFRGADPRAMLGFGRQFPTTSGAPAPVLALRRARRFDASLAAASRSVAARLPVLSTSAGHRDLLVPKPASESPPGPASGYGSVGAVRVMTFDSPRAEVEHIADLLRRAHLHDGFQWSEMAVLVRNGKAGVASMRRGLVAAGVPVVLAADDTPLSAESAVSTLLAPVRAVLEANTEPGSARYVDDQAVQSLLLSPLANLDAAEVRLLAKAWYTQGVAGATAKLNARSAPEQVSSASLLRAAVLQPDRWGGLRESLEKGPQSVSRPLARALAKAEAFGQLMTRIAVAVDADEPAEQVLWQVWSGTSWPERLRASALSGSAGSLGAHATLDAITALFNEAAKVEEQRGHTSVDQFLAGLEAQRLPAHSLAEQGVRANAVRLLTAHRSKGAEWRLVVVAGVQEGTFPDLRARSSLLGVDELATSGPLDALPVSQLLAQERRLFYVACTRAKERLVVSAVRSVDDDGEQPSRFCTELGVDPEHVSGRPPRPANLNAVTAELRRTLAHPDTSEALKHAAAHRLAALVSLRGPQGALVPAADPATWWGLRSFSHSATPVRDPEKPLRISASTLAAITTCGAQWFLSREAGGSSTATSAQGLGKIVHALADRTVKGDLGKDVDVETLMGLVDEVWTQLDFRIPWAVASDRRALEAMLHRLLVWQSGSRDRTFVASEVPLEATVEIAGEQIVLNGYADRLELDVQGRVVVVDFKTGKNPPSTEAVRTDPQLGLYSLAVEHGAAERAVGQAQPGPGPEAPQSGEGQDLRTPGGAELVQLRHSTRGVVKVQTQTPQTPDESGRRPVENQLMAAAKALRDEEFAARPGDHCRYCDFAALCPTQVNGSVLS